MRSWWIPATPASTTQNIGCPSIMTPSKMGKTKNLIFYSLNGGNEVDNSLIMLLFESGRGTPRDGTGQLDASAFLLDIAAQRQGVDTPYTKARRF